MLDNKELSEFYKNKKVLITGHTGFKGSWMCAVLSKFGAKVIGYSLPAPTEPALYDLLNLGSVDTYRGDIRDLNFMSEVFEKTQPEIVIHMAAQPIVRESYKSPVETYEINVMGTVNLLECCRRTKSVRSVINVTTDKVYLNRECERGYVETDTLDGYDPYSNSKSCSELVTHSYIQSFFSDNISDTISGVPNRKLAVSTCRAGNVVGGGDFAADRIIPDCVRAAKDNKNIEVRNPYSIRPYEHVLEPVVTYLQIAMMQYEDLSYASNYNVGPDEESCVTTGELVDMFVTRWNGYTDGQENSATNLQWLNKHDGGPHEAGYLKLDCTKLKETFGWKPIWNISETMDKVVDWYRAYLLGKDIRDYTYGQIESFLTKEI